MLRPSSQNAWQSRVANLSLELVVIVLGVLVALAADRWNQTRIDRAVQDAYLARFVGEIRADSVRAAEYVDTQPGVVAALDSLESFISGGTEPPDLVATTLAVSVEFSAFRARPGMRELLVAVGNGHYFQRAIAGLVMEEAGRVLRILESPN